MKPHESPRIRKKSIHGDSGDSWPVWNRGISYILKLQCSKYTKYESFANCTGFKNAYTMNPVTFYLLGVAIFDLYIIYIIAVK